MIAPQFVVPDVVTDLCRERVIVTEFVDGRRFEEIVAILHPAAVP